MLTAIATVFLYGHSFRVVLLILYARVVASFAIAASERDDDAIVFFSQRPYSP
jgi:hypothetical protein